MTTARDIMHAGKTAGELAQGKAYTVDVNADLDDVLAQMEQHKVRRLLVIEEHRLVGIISEADLGRHLSEVSPDKVGHFVKAVSA